MTKPKETKRNLAKLYVPGNESVFSVLSCVGNYSEMQKDDNTGCSDHDAPNMIMKAIEPTPVQRMRSVT
jgi:hypothetical protein